MRHMIDPAVVAALIASTSLASAGYSAFGTVKWLDFQSMTLTLTDGQVFGLPEGWDDPQVGAGDQVAIIYEVEEDELEAMRVLIDDSYDE